MDTIKQLIDKFNLISKKSLGQNFILDENITDKIVKLSGIKNQFVLEIGPGPGCLTRSLIKGGAKKIIDIEKDLKCIEIITTIRLANFLSIDFEFCYLLMACYYFILFYCSSKT